MKKSKIVILILIVSIASLTIGAFLGGIFPVKGLFYPYLGLFSDVLTIIEKDYVDSISSADPLIEGAIKGLLSGLDQGCSYLSKNDVEELKQRSNKGKAESGFEFLKLYYFLLVTSVHQHSPAEKVGLKPGDQIIKMNGKSPRYLSLTQCRKFIRGEEGTELVLSVIKTRTFKKEDIKIVMEISEHPGFELSLKDNDIAYLKVTSLQNVDPVQVALSLKKIGKEASSLLLDLRDSSSGDYNKAVSFSSLFVESGPILVLMKKGLEEQIIPSSPHVYWWRKTFHILINSRTAGPSEAIASTLRYQRHAPILGENSFGLALDQELILLEDGTGVILSTSKYRPVHGSSWNKDGIKPDYEIKSIFPLPEGKPDQQLQESFKFIIEAQASKLDKVA